MYHYCPLIDNHNNHIVDFTGIRDIDEVMRLANEAGIYVSARPGPYM